MSNKLCYSDFNKNPQASASELFPLEIPNNNIVLSVFSSLTQVRLFNPNEVIKTQGM